MATTIQSMIQSAAPGSTITVAAGTYDVSGLVLPGNITLKAGGAVTLTGSMTVGGSNTTVSGFTFSGGTVNIGGTVGTTIENNTFKGGSRSINLDAARDAEITNNAFHNVSGNVIAGWGLDQSTISGNKFYDSWQPINLNFNNNTSQGRYIKIEDNYFTGTQRMPIEVGPSEAYTLNMLVQGNWSENMNNAGKDGAWSTDVAYSLVQGNGVNTMIKGNYAKGIGSGVGIELNGTGGEISGNYVDNFWYGSIVYGKGYNVHDNAFVGQYIERVLNYGNQSGTIQNNQTTSAGFTMPQKPGTTAPAPAPSEPVTSDPTPPPTGDTGTGSGNPVYAGDDNYKTGVDQKWYFNTKYLMMNDKGADGGLKVPAVASKSAAGATVTLDGNGTAIYTPLKGWQGKDSIEYTLMDRDGSTDTGIVYMQVGSGTTTPPPSGGGTTTPPPPSTGSGNPVAVGDDFHRTGDGQKHYFNSKYLLLNDIGKDGGLKVTDIDAVTVKGGSVKWDTASGTAIYTPKAGFTGRDSVEYAIADRDGSSDTGHVHIDVLLV